jgi:Arc/MetJ-type ribon-helix-helix transcriptional regulator
MEQLLSLALQLLLPIIAASVVAFIWKLVGAEGMRKIEHELSSKSEYVKIGVRLIEQVYKDLKGQEKADKAFEWITARLNENGIHFTEEELRGMIESAVRQFKDEFGDNWTSGREKELANGGFISSIPADLVMPTDLTPEKVEEIAKKFKLTNYTAKSDVVE